MNYKEFSLTLIVSLVILIQLVHSQAGNSSSDSNSISSSGGKKECVSEPEYIYPNPDNCTSFYKCWQGKLYPIECPEPLAFNVELRVCDWKWNVTTCDEKPVTNFGLS